MKKKKNLTRSKNEECCYIKKNYFRIMDSLYEETTYAVSSFSNIILIIYSIKYFFLQKNYIQLKINIQIK